MSYNNSSFKRFSTNCLTLLLLCNAALCLPLQAKQLRYSKVDEGEQIQFHYKWLDSHQKQQALTFTLTKKALFNRFREFKAFNSHIANKTMMRNVKKQLDNEPIDDVKIEIIHLGVDKNSDLAIKITGQEQLKVKLADAKIKRMQQQEIKKYYTTHYYHLFEDHHKNSAIKVDHGSIARGSVADFKPLSSIILKNVDVKSVRLVTNFILGFSQSIPYSTLESKATSSGAGFSPPLKLLFENQGDCDSKMTLTIALLRAVMPRIKMIMIYIDNHTFIGINAPIIEGDTTLIYNNVNYVLADSTGPKMLALGKITTESEMAIHQGHYVVEEYRD